MGELRCLVNLQSTIKPINDLQKHKVQRLSSKCKVPHLILGSSSERVEETELTAPDCD
ncbi:Hypothetical protein SMAX5B_007748, partial [Scophthalmus maximus]